MIYKHEGQVPLAFNLKEERYLWTIQLSKQVLAMARREVYNKNEKAIRNKEIFMERESGELIVELAQRYGLSIPRIHRIVMQEENKYLKERTEKLSAELTLCRRR